ncbi:MAG TPA: molybdopterin molybdenumtransferase MoeA [Lachnospiraceae bacterium]|nr:molybdopterin molybdenumtransferase MoeA [Lachnospiraceae bacterium]
MRRDMNYQMIRDQLLAMAVPAGTEHVCLKKSMGRILAEPFAARENVPAFDRSPYDGFAFLAADSAEASEAHPVTLKIQEEIAAGMVPQKTVTPGTAAKILTGAPIPGGADTVVMYEKTRFTEDTVTLFQPAGSGSNIVYAGEDVEKGQVLAESGTKLDAGLIGTLAAQGITEPLVYVKPCIGVLSTGSEVMDAGETVGAGKIRDSNRYMLAAALHETGCDAEDLGLIRDHTKDIAARIEKGLTDCDALLITGGVSAGDFDLTPAAMERAGANVLCRGVDIKPGMACAYGEKGGKFIFALSGNPASAMTNFYVVVWPVLRKLAGCREFLPQEFPVTLAEDFPKKSPRTRFLRGKLDLSDGTVRMHLSARQGNAVLSSAIGCDGMAMIPAGSGPIPGGTRLKGFRI